MSERRRVQRPVAAPAPAPTAAPARAPLPVSNHATSALLQRFTRVRVTPHAFGSLTTNGMYLLFRARLWARTGAPVPRACASTTNTRQHGGHTYREYTPNMQFVTDCLHTAEEIMHQTTYRVGARGPARSEARDDPQARAFGWSAAGNVDIANRVATVRRGGHRVVNNRARPAVGQAYAIVETGIVAAGGYPYHAAAVIASDGGDRITMEMLAGSRDADEAARGATSPRFRMYGSTAQTFHSMWSASFSNPVTIVLERR